MFKEWGLFKKYQRTKRPMWVKAFRFIGYTFFLVLAPLIFVTGDILSRVIFTDGQVLWYVSIVLFIVSATLSLPFAYLLLIHRFRKRYISILHYSVQFLIIGGLLFTDSILLKFSGGDKFNHTYGNCSTTLGGILKTTPGQSFYHFFLKQFPLPTQYAVESFEDACRINLIKQDFAYSTPTFCGETERTICLDKVFEDISVKAPLTPSGIILAATFRSLALYKKIDHIRQSKKLSIIDHMRFTVRLLDISNWSLERIKDSSNIGRMAGDKLARKFHELPNEDKGYYDIVIRNKFLDISDFRMTSALSVVTAAPLRELPSDVDRKLAEYALIQLMDNKVRSEYFESTSSKGLLIIARSLDQLEKSHKDGAISDEDYQSLKATFSNQRKLIESLL